MILSQRMLCSLRTLLVSAALALFLAMPVLSRAATPNASAGRAAVPQNTLPRVSVGGTDHVSLSRWAKLGGFKGSYDSRSKVLVLWNQNFRLRFYVDSRKAEFNGVTTLLSLPVVMVGGNPLISVIDYRSTLQPFVYPQKSPKFQVKTVCLDPGHGGGDTGKIYGNAYEKNYTLLLAREVASLLRAKNIKTVMTREKDLRLELSDRTAFASRAGADLFVSLHYNSAPNRDIQGVEIFCITPPGAASSNEGGGRARNGANLGNVQNSQNMLLAYYVQKSILNTTGLVDRGVKRSRFLVLREAKIPAILIEGGFMTNPADFRKINDPVFRKKMAQAIANGILAYKQAVEVR